MQRGFQDLGLAPALAQAVYASEGMPEQPRQTRKQGPISMVDLTLLHPHSVILFSASLPGALMLNVTFVQNMTLNDFNDFQ